MGDKSPKAKMKLQKEKDGNKAKIAAELQRERDAKSAAGAKTTKK